MFMHLALYLLKVLGYVKLAVNEGGEIVCGEGKDSPLELPSPHAEVQEFKNTCKFQVFLCRVVDR